MRWAVMVKNSKYRLKNAKRPHPPGVLHFSTDILSF